MIGFAVYSTTASPDRLYATGDTSTIDAETTAERVWAGDRPLDFVVDLSERRLWWTFQADRETKARRSGHFVAAGQGGQDMFREFAAALRQLHSTDDWDVPYQGTLEADLGFELWRLPATVEQSRGFERLRSRLTEREEGTDPLRVGMENRRSAFETVRALDSSAVECTVAIDERGVTTEDVDLLLIPGAPDDFEMETRSDTPTNNHEETTATVSGPEPDTRADSGRTIGGFTARISGVVLVGLLGFAAYSFVTRQPVRPISGLATFGGFLGALGAALVWHLPFEEGETVWGHVSQRATWVVPAITGGTLAGFVYPKLVWQAGLFAGRDGFLFGPLGTLGGSLPATAVYVGLLFAGVVTAVVVGAITRKTDTPSVGESIRLSAGFACYGLSLLLATGLAERVWYDFIPAM